MKNVLITGANGQLGNEIRSLAEKKYLKQLNFIYTDVEDLDITDLKALQSYFSDVQIDFIVNCAAYTNVDKAESDIENAEMINSVAVGNLAKITEIYEIPFIHLSTDYVFDGMKSTAYSEEDETNPVTTYGRSKLNGETEAAKAFKFVILRTSWLYSKYGHNFVKTMLRLGHEKDEINVVNDQKGSPTNAEDLAEAIIAILNITAEDPEKFKSGIYHYSNEGSCTWFEFAQEIMKLSKVSCAVQPVDSSQFPTIAKRPAYSLMDKTKIKENYNIQIPHWRDSLKKFLSEFTLDQ